MAAFLFGTFAMLFHATGHVVHHETLEVEWSVVIKPYKFTTFEILDFERAVYCMSTLFPTNFFLSPSYVNETSKLSTYSCSLVASITALKYLQDSLMKDKD